MLHRVLVAEADPSLLEALELVLAGRGYEVLCASSAEQALARARRWLPDLILWGFEETADEPGPTAVVRHLPEASLVVMSDDPAHASHSLEPGGPAPAFDDLLQRPVTERQLALVLHRAGVQARLRRARRLLETELREEPGDRPIVGASTAMIELLESIERAAGFETPVLLHGERGTGKGGLARTLHAQSSRRRGPFVAVRCAHRDASDLGPELFGQVNESDTSRPGRFFDAQGGTLYLEDVEGLAPDLQRRLLESLQSRAVIPAGDDKPWPIDARVLAASRDLERAVAEGRFRGDLYERLAAVTLRVPALRERTEDIPLLLDHFVRRSCRAIGRPPLAMSDEILQRLVAYAWPGNVRELQNLVERAVILAAGDRLLPRDFPERLEPPEPPAEDAIDLGLRRRRRQLEVELIRTALRRTGGNRTHAARLLEISHRALLYKIKEYGITD